MALDLLRRRRRQNGKKIAALCMIIACFDDEGEGVRKKRPDRDWLKKKSGERVLCAYAGFVTELAGLFLMTKRNWKLINIVFIVAKPLWDGETCFGRKSCVRETEMFLTSGKNIFCFRAAKFVSATCFPCG